MEFKRRVKIGIEWSRYLKRNNIQLPLCLKDRRKIFIDWYFERYSKRPFHKVFKELALEVLYIEETTLGNIIFSEKQEA